MAANRDQNVPVFIYLTPKMKKDLDKIVRVKGTTMSALGRQLLDEYIEKQKAKPA